MTLVPFLLWATLFAHVIAKPAVVFDASYNVGPPL